MIIWHEVVENDMSNCRVKILTIRMSEKAEFLTELTKIIELKLLQVQRDLNKKME